MLAPLVKELLESVDGESRYKAEAERIMKKYENIPEISREYVPKDSFFREFIGN